MLDTQRPSVKLGLKAGVPDIYQVYRYDGNDLVRSSVELSEWVA